MSRADIHRRIYIVLLALLGGSMVTSVWMANLAWVLLSVNWLCEGRWREKWQMARESRLLQLIVAGYLLLTVALAWSSNLEHGLSVLQVKLPLLVVPLIVLTTQPITGRPRRIVLGVYAITVLVVSIIALVRILTIPDLPYRDSVPYISHIRFSLNCCMVIFLCIGFLITGKTSLRWLVLPLAAWLLVFVLLLHSYTAVIILTVVSLIVMLTRYRRWPLIGAWLLLVGGLSAAIVHEGRAYYHLIPQATSPLRPLTEGGRPYRHAQDGMIENGNYINNYVCREELRAEWSHRSTLPYDSILSNGYTVEPTLVRYLNALGLTKDSVGVSALSPTQIADIERGVANPVYLSKNPLRKMVYVMLLEREFYVHTHAVRGFTLLQRFELWGATCEVISRHPWIGVGTGDVDDELHACLAQRHSALADTTMSPHNQYLSFLATFGIIGIALLLILIIRICTRVRKPLPALMLAWLLTILISCITEDTFDTLAGILFCTWFLPFRRTTEVTHKT